MDKFSTPPGFASKTSFVLKRVSHEKESSSLSGSRQPSWSALGQDEITVSNMADAESFKKYLGNRPWILHDQTTLSSEASKPLRHEELFGRRLPKVEKVEILEEAPVFHPTEEEFSDTLAYIASLRERAEHHGICCVVPPPSWKPPCHLKDRKIWEDSMFSTQVQLFGGIPTESSEMKKEANGNSKKIQFCSNIGPVYTLDKFKNFADTYKKEHFSMKDEVLGNKKSPPSLKPEETSVADIEQEYKQLVESPKVELGVLYGNDLDTSVFGSGFTSCEASESWKYSKSGWNLNNTAKLPGSLLCLEDCKSVCVPRLSVGMCFSSQLWKGEKDRLYSLCYLHMGAPRVWYAVPGRCSYYFKTTRESYIAEFSKGSYEMHHETVMTMSPYVLSTEGIPVSRCVQSRGQFVIIFPGSYYSGFDTGFNCLEKVNFAPLDWLPHGHTALMLNQEKRKRSSISYDKVLFSAAREAVRCLSESLLFRKNTADNTRWKDACGSEGILYKVLKSRVKHERSQMEYFSNPLQSQKMDKYHDAESKRKCDICFVDLHLSAVQCSCSADRYSCLIHAKKLCPCANRTFLYRYTMDDLNVLVDAVGGKYSAIYRWAKQYLNFSRSSMAAGSYTSNPETQRQNKKPDESPLGATQSSTRKNDAASIKAQLKARVKAKARSLEEIMKVKEDKDVSPSVMGGKTCEKGLFEVMDISSSLQSDEGDDLQVADLQCQRKGGSRSNRKNGEESSKSKLVHSEKSSPKKSSMSFNSKKQRQN